MRLNRLHELADLAARLGKPASLVRRGGVVASVSGGLCRVAGFGPVRPGAFVTDIAGQHPIGEVVEAGIESVTVGLYDPDASPAPGDLIFEGALPGEPLADHCLGRVLNALGSPLDGMPPVRRALPPRQSGPDGGTVSALDRAPLREPLATGIRVVDLFMPLCYGQRIGIFAGSGVGKSTLLGMLAMSDAFDAAVVVLVGERGREVREFIDGTVGPGAMAKTIFVVSPADQSPMLQRRAPELAARLADSLRGTGKRVLLLIDSLTRLAHADRRVAIALGEPPVARGYPASTFGLLARLLERGGAGAKGAGSVTVIATVLVDGDDHNDPAADFVRGTVDGHIVLDRAIANAGRFPAVDIRASVSRLADRVWTPDQREVVRRLRALISRFEETSDLRLIGGWTRGTDVELDRAVDVVPVLYDCLRQSPSDPVSADAFADVADALRRSGDGASAAASS